MSDLLAQQFFPHGSGNDNDEHRAALAQLFDALNLVSNLSITIQLLTGLKRLFDVANASCAVTIFTDKNDDFIENWREWRGVVGEALEVKLTLDDTAKHIVTRRSTTPLLDIFLCEDPDQPNEDTSSNIEGLKLITLIFLIYKLRFKQRVDFEKVIKRIRLTIAKVHTFKGLNLNFYDGADPEEIIEQCETLVESTYFEKSPEREFLDYLKNILRTLAGNRVGLAHRRGGRVKTVRLKNSKSKSLETPRLSDILRIIKQMKRVCMVLH